MIIKKYKNENFSLSLCDFNKANNLYIYFIFTNGNKDLLSYIFKTHNFGIKTFNEKNFINAVKDSNVFFNTNINDVIKAIKSFYPLTQYIKIIGE